MQRAHAGDPVVAEEAVQHAGEVEPRDDEAAEVGDQRDVRGERARGLRGVGPRGGGEGGRGPLEGQVDVEEGGDRLHGRRVLRVVEEVALAGLVFGVPFEDVELRVVGALGRGGDGRLGGEGGGGVGERGRAGVRVRTRGRRGLGRGRGLVRHLWES